MDVLTVLKVTRHWFNTLECDALFIFCNCMYVFLTLCVWVCVCVLLTQPCPPRNTSDSDPALACPVWIWPGRTHWWLIHSEGCTPMHTHTETLMSEGERKKCRWASRKKTQQKAQTRSFVVPFPFGSVWTQQPFNVAFLTKNSVEESDDCCRTFSALDRTLITIICLFPGLIQS